MVDGFNQREADRLIELPKRAESLAPVNLPDFGGKVAVPLVSLDARDTFILDISRGRIDLRKGTNQLRTQQVIVLVRLDYNGSPHRNPDDVEISSPHIHIYREAWSDKWAYPLPAGIFTNLDDHWTTLQEFLTYCAIVTPPNFRRGLFS